jgi:hypothetical protein
VKWAQWTLTWCQRGRHENEQILLRTWTEWRSDFEVWGIFEFFSESRSGQTSRRAFVWKNGVGTEQLVSSKSDECI